MTASRTSNRQARPRSRKSKAVRIVLSLLFYILLLEGGARLYWWIDGGVSPLRPDRAMHMHRFYPQVRESRVLDKAITQDDDVFDVLLLGGSVLHPHFGSIAVLLQQQLTLKLNRPVHIFNVAAPAHTSRDSLLKFEHIAAEQPDTRFDMVVFYHGINETRMNNAPDDAYRSDYTHASWYARIAAIDRHPELDYIALPYTLHLATISICDKLGIGGHIPRHRPSEELLQYGSNIRSDKAFESNLSKLLILSEQRNEPVLLMTFAYHYQTLTEHSDPATLYWYRKREPSVGLWGEAKNVIAAMDRHNQVVRHQASIHDHAAFADLAQTMPGEGPYFTDICHLSPKGVQVWVNEAVAAIADTER
jgi:hypothetical protein